MIVFCRACVVNRAVHELRRRGVLEKEMQEGNTELWRALHVPQWVGASERACIEQRLDAFVDGLLVASRGLPALAQLCQALTKPLRASWVSPDSPPWKQSHRHPSNGDPTCK